MFRNIEGFLFFIFYFFLTELVQKGLFYSSINSTKSALSTFLILPNGQSIGCHIHLFQGLEKGCQFMPTDA